MSYRYIMYHILKKITDVRNRGTLITGCYKSGRTYNDALPLVWFTCPGYLFIMDFYGYIKLNLHFGHAHYRLLILWLIPCGLSAL